MNPYPMPEWLPVVTAILLIFVLFIFFAVFLNFFDKPDYVNVHPVSKRTFPNEKIDILERERRQNNPYNEDVGIGTGRCQYCGYKHMLDPKMIKFEKLLQKNIDCPMCRYDMENI